MVRSVVFDIGETLVSDVDEARRTGLLLLADIFEAVERHV